MTIYTIKNGGFCFGVKRAVDTALNIPDKNGYILGEIIHNDEVNKKLCNSGLTVIDSIDDSKLKPNDTVLIRAHGEPKSTFITAEEKGLNIIDCTCPFVREIQKIVEYHYKKGYTIAIIGNAGHPEIIGINGWCNNSAYVCSSLEDLSAIKFDKLCIVVQTTFSEEKFDEIIKKFTYSGNKTVDIFNTICYTTKKRQTEAEVLSKKCDCVIVLGGANSNNTNKLFDICSENCKNVFRLISPKDFDYKKLLNFKRIGVVLGASTPIEQFQEVISSMENVTEETIKTETVESAVEPEKVEKASEKTKEKSAKSEMEAAFDSIKPSKNFKVGQIITAKISSAKDDGLTLSMKNAKKDFELPSEEMISEYNKDDYKDKIGQDIRVMVVAKNPVKFSEKAMQKVLKEEAEIAEIKDGKIFESVITATNKGGLVGKYGSYEVFIPASQIKLGFVKDLDKYVGKTLRLKAEKVESKGSRRQIVGSQKVILEAEKAERDAIRAEKEAEFFNAIQEGDVVVGTPVRFAPFGVFVDVNGFDCLAHISDLSWTGCKECSDVLQLGKEYEFKIMKIDAENKKVSIGYKQLQARPWDLVPTKYAVGDVIKGKVVRIVNFGAFVEIEKGIDGLVHVSQITNKWLENPTTELQVGQEVDAKILEINLEKEKINLSIKALLPEEPKTEEQNEKAAGKKKVDKVEDDELELREWKDDDNGGISIAEMLNDKQ